MLIELLHECDRLLLLQECHWLLTDDWAADWNGHTVCPGMYMPLCVAHCCKRAREACDGQAYGAENFREIGLLLQRALVICTVCSAPLALVWLFGAPPVLALIMEDRTVSDKASLYLKLMIPSLPALIMFEAAKRVLQSQSIMMPMLRAAMICVLPHLFFCWLLIHKLEFGLVGAPFATAISYWGMLALLFRDVHSNHHEQLSLCWPGWHLGEACDRTALAVYLKLAVPGTVMLSLEWWSFELMAAAAGDRMLPDLDSQHQILTASTRS